MANNPFKIQEGSVRDSKVRGFLSTKQSGDYLEFTKLDNASYVGQFFKGKKMSFLFIFIVFLILLLFSRAFYLQIVKGDYYRSMAEGNRIKTEVIKANRGLVYDRFGNTLLKNNDYFFLYINTEFLPKDEEALNNLLDNLSLVISLDKEEMINRLDIENSKVLLYEDLEYDSAMKLIIWSEEYPSIEIRYEPRRDYLKNIGLSHIFGHLGLVTAEEFKEGGYGYNDRIGKSGIELIYEDILKGKDGIKQIEVDALYNEKSIISIQKPVNGQDIVLSLDLASQEKLFDIMLDYSFRYGKTKMAGVVLNPNDGGVLAMVSLPTFDNNMFTSSLDKDEYNNIINNEDNPLLNRVISGIYPLGSIFKLVVAGAALEEEIINTGFTVNSIGGVEAGSSFFPDWRPSGHGITNVFWAIADSVNTFFYTIGGGNNEWLQYGLGVDRIIEYAKFFGLGNIIGIDLPAEAKGFLPSKEWKQEEIGERWYLGDTYNLSIGQGYLLATPLQAAVFTSYFANNGVVYIPHILQNIKDEEEKEFEIALTDIISSDNLYSVRQGMHNTVLYGTAKSMQSVSVDVAGKTGTAQFHKRKIPHSWFSGFAPYDNPKIVISVIVEEGGDKGLAVSVAREFMEWYFLTN